VVRAVSTAEEDIEDELFVGVVEESAPLAVPTISSGMDLWTISIFLNECPIQFQIDTGADTSENQHQKLEIPGLQSSIKSLVRPSQGELQVCGKFTGSLTYKSNTITQEVYVVKGLQKFLIGWLAIMAFKLISQDNTVKSE